MRPCLVKNKNNSNNILLKKKKETVFTKTQNGCSILDHGKSNSSFLVVPWLLVLNCLTLPPIPTNSTPVHDSGCYWSRQGQTLALQRQTSKNGATKQSCHITGGEIPTVPNPSLTWLQQGGLTSCQNCVESLPGRQVPSTGCSSSPSVRFLGKIPFPWEPLSQ